MKSKDHDTILDKLSIGEILVVGQLTWSSNYTFLAQVKGPGWELPAIYKPSEGESPLWDFPQGCDPRAVAAGISQALITTAAGLIIAIPTVTVYSYLRQRVNKILIGMERFSHGFVNALITEVGRFVSYKETLKFAYADGILEEGEKELLHRKRILLNITEEKASHLEQEIKKELGL